MKPFLSVIIPVYKVEAYLERCVHSVLNQDFTDIEVILVDDGSPDRCPDICDELSRNDERVVVIHKENGGLSSARNAGMKIAKGIYLAFLDSDDQWAEGQLKKLIQAMEGKNIPFIMFRSYSLYSDGTLMERDDHALFHDEVNSYDVCDLYRILIPSGDLHEQAGTHIIQTSFCRDNNLYFTEGLLGEDTEWMFRVLRITDTILAINIPLQIYTESNSNSITHNIKSKNVSDLLEIIKKSLAFADLVKDCRTVKYELAHCSYLWSTALGLYNNIPQIEKNTIKPDFYKIKKRLILNDHPKSRLVGMVYDIFGLQITSRILSIYIKLHKMNIINKKAILS